jgi:hypothetical protein
MTQGFKKGILFYTNPQDQSPQIIFSPKLFFITFALPFGHVPKTRYLAEN